MYKFIAADDVIVTSYFWTFVNNDFQAEYSLLCTIIQRVIINNNEIFNVRQQEYYCVTDKLGIACSKLTLPLARSHYYYYY